MLRAFKRGRKEEGRAGSEFGSMPAMADGPRRERVERIDEATAPILGARVDQGNRHCWPGSQAALSAREGLGRAAVRRWRRRSDDRRKEGDGVRDNTVAGS